MHGDVRCDAGGPGRWFRHEHGQWVLRHAAGGFDADSVTVNATQHRAISVVKTGTWVDANLDGYADPGDLINYTFDVTNDGNVTLTNVTVVDTVGGVTMVSVPTTLDVGETDSATFSASYAITQGDIDAGHFANIATADSDESPSAIGDEDVSLLQHRAISVVKTGTWVDANLDGYADPGDLINYTFDVTNDGNVTLTNVTVVDTVGGVAIGRRPDHAGWW